MQASPNQATRFSRRQAVARAGALTLAGDGDGVTGVMTFDVESA